MEFLNIEFVKWYINAEPPNKNNNLTFNVSDQGNGFDFSDLPDPTLPENIEKPHGRGIFLMRQLSEEVVFEEPGNKVELTFKV